MINAILSDTDVLLWITFILCFFLGTLILLGIGLVSVKRHIKKGIGNLKSFDTGAAVNRTDYVKIQKIFKEDKVLGNQWREFEECVVADRKDDTEDYRNTLPASEFFNFDDVVNTANTWILNIKFNFFNVVPNLLTGLGILGTFVGIIFGLGELTEVDTITGLPTGGIDTNQIGEFIAGIKISFHTSIAGLGSATVFTMIEKYWIDRAEHYINELAQEIDRLFHRKTEQEYLNQIHEAIQEQSTTLKTISSEIGQEIVKSFTGLGVDSVDISDSVKKGIGEGFAKLGSNLDKINELQERHHEATKLIIEESKTVGIGITALNRAVQGYVGSIDTAVLKFDETSQKLTSLNQMQKEQMDSFGTITQNVVQASDLSQKNIDNLISATGSFQDNLSKTASELSTMVNSFTGLVDEYNSKTQNAITGTFTSFDIELSKAVTKLGAGITNMSEGVEELSEYLFQLKEVASQAQKNMKLPTTPESSDE